MRKLYPKKYWIMVTDKKGMLEDQEKDGATKWD